MKSEIPILYYNIELRLEADVKNSAFYTLPKNFTKCICHLPNAWRT